MVPELGLFLLIIAASASLLSLGSGLLGSSLVQVRALRLSATLVIASLFVLAYSFYHVDLSLQIVYQHADPALPLWYRIGAVWGGHEGSMLLWLSILNIWVLIAAGLRLAPDIKNTMLTVLSSVNLGFLLFILLSSNPFARYLPITPISGQDLNPFLQDPVMLIHPPILYMGYLGFVLPFALAIAMLWKSHFERSVMVIMQKCVLVAWSFLTLGIALGSFWAYYELGWGGWWFWDPVENASLMPWLAGCALLHMLRVSVTRQAFISWSLLLCLVAFGLSILGTFLVRSGALTSVHSFANDPARGLFILGLLALYILPALALFSIKSTRIQASAPINLASREGLILSNNVILMVILSTVILGTLYPLAIESLGLGFISVGAPYFNRLVVPMGVALGLLMCAAWLLRGSRRVSLRNLGMHLAHVGFICLALGITVTSIYSIEDDVVLDIGQSHRINDYLFTLDSVSPVHGPNYTSAQAVLTVSEQGKYLTTMKPEKRFYTQRNMPIAQIALEGNLMRDLYVALSEPIGDKRWVLRIQVKPMVRFIWLGALLMSLGGFMSFITKRTGGTQ